jgi:hypothetical protein
MLKRTRAFVSFSPSRVAVNPATPIVVSAPIRVPTALIAAEHITPIMASRVMILADRSSRIIPTEVFIRRLGGGNGAWARQNGNDYGAEQQTI